MSENVGGVMFENVGGKLKKIAVGLFILDIIVAIVIVWLGLGMAYGEEILIYLVVALLVCVCGYCSSLLFYGFAEMMESVVIIKKEITKENTIQSVVGGTTNVPTNQPVVDGTTNVPTNQPVVDGSANVSTNSWKCECGEINSSDSIYCTCGMSRY